MVGQDEWFWHVLALALGGRTVLELKGAMTQMEFDRWRHFYVQQPFDDLHRFHRPAALAAAAMNGDLRAGLDFLTRPIQTAEEDADEATLKAFGLGKLKES